MSLEDLGLTPDPVDPGRGESRRRRVAWAWIFGGLGAAVATTLAVVLIVMGLGHAPAPAPLPPDDFAVAPSQVPDPVTGALPVIGSTPAPDTVPSIPAATGRVVPAAAQQGEASAASSTSAKPTVRRQTPSGVVQDNRLIIPAVGIDAQVGMSGIADGELVLPSDVDKTTEWDGSAPIDGAGGTILVAGHVDNVNQGEGAMWPLHLTQPGDAVYLTRYGVVTRWKIVSVQSVVKADLPQDLFAGDLGPRLLKLVTCGGKVVHDSQGRGSYVDNVIATAVPF